VARELALTARTIDGAEAERVGLVSRCFADNAALLAAAEQTAQDLAAKSPVAVTGTKRIMLHSRRGSPRHGILLDARMAQYPDVH
jgi:enoyl-CoA hydratase/carnithine racemase